MTTTQEQADWFAETFAKLVANVEQAVLGKHHVIELMFTAMISEGHVLLEDFPGTGKTSLARAISETVEGVSNRIQFTPDMLPGDITGISVYDQKKGDWEFHAGPIFSNVVLADEINRASAKTQSALLEVMEERQVTSDGVSRPAPSPFMVVATQNPLDFQGTYPLPEVQLDRFAMKISLGYADRASELELMGRQDNGVMLATLPAVLPPDGFRGLIEAVRAVSVSLPLRNYVADILEATREHQDLRLGVSTRGTLILLAVSRAYALGAGRDFVTPDDIKAVGHSVLAHRVAVTTEAEIDGVLAADILRQVLDSVPVPRVRTTHSDG